MRGMSVGALQRLFLDHVIDAERTLAPAFERGASGIGIYRHAYRAQLISCLRGRYDKSWSWMGDVRFDRAAHHYIDNHIPNSWSLDNYGAAFPETLARLFPDDPEIADLAALEQALHTTFVKADAEAIEPSALADFIHSGRDVEALKVSFVPSFSVISVCTNVAAISQAISDNSPIPALVVYGELHFICLWRVGHSTHFREMDSSEAHALIAMAEGTDFGSVCRAMAERDEELSAAHLGGWLARWIADKMVLALV
jgi:hypothetical protein